MYSPRWRGRPNLLRCEPPGPGRRRLCRSRSRYVDAVVAQGFEAGGPVRGLTATLPLVPAVVDAVSPLLVIAAGGIADG
ncbi:nitronate monooxygenase [Streptomyces sp. NPDC058287]|uniref:nitronate monooxygenase n=1 Tax=unclassified Streptomyces TaxID=2593676 RepID=UPI0036EFAD5A